MARARRAGRGGGPRPRESPAGRAGQAARRGGGRRPRGGGGVPPGVVGGVAASRGGAGARQHRCRPAGRVGGQQPQLGEIRNGGGRLVALPLVYSHAAPPAPRSWPRLTRARSSPSSSSVSALSPPASTASVRSEEHTSELQSHL